MIHLFDNPHPVNHLVILFLALFLPLGFYWDPPATQLGDSFISWSFGSQISGIFEEGTAWLVFLKSILIYVQSLYFNRICSSVGLFHHHTLLPATVFVICASYLSVFFSFHLLLIGFFFFLMAIEQLLNVKKAEDRFAENLFYSTFFVSVASLFFTGYGYFIIWVWLLLPAIGAMTLRHFVLSITGFVMPYFLAGVYFFTMDNFMAYLVWLQDAIPSFTFFAADFNNALWIPVLFFLLGWLKYKSAGVRLLQETKAGFTIFQVALIPGFLQFFLPVESLEYGFYLFLPGFAVFINYFFFEKKEKLTRKIAFLVYIAFAFILPWALWLRRLWIEWLEDVPFFGS